LVYLLGKIQSTFAHTTKTDKQASKQTNKPTKINIPKLAPTNPFFLPTEKNSIHLTHTQQQQHTSKQTFKTQNEYLQIPSSSSSSSSSYLPRKIQATLHPQPTKYKKPKKKNTKQTKPKTSCHQSLLLTNIEKFNLPHTYTHTHTQNNMIIIQASKQTNKQNPKKKYLTNSFFLLLLLSSCFTSSILQFEAHPISTLGNSQCIINHHHYHHHHHDDPPPFKESPQQHHANP
jgi:glutamyl/glutaminyl-tRNA synthetase